MEYNVKDTENINTDINKSNICLSVKETYGIMAWNVKSTKKNMNTDIN